MSYTPNTWQRGDVVTSAKLNNIEQGITNAGSEVLVCIADENTGVLDHTWQEIHDAKLALLKYPGTSTEGYYIYEAVRIGAPTTGPDAGKYYVRFNEWDFASEAADGYPIIITEGEGSTT